MTKFENNEPQTRNLGERSLEDRCENERLNRDQVVEKIADAVRANAGKVSTPTGFYIWTTEYFKQPACGEILYEACGKNQQIILRMEFLSHSFLFL